MWPTADSADGDQALALYAHGGDHVRQSWQIDDGCVEIDPAEVYRLTLRGWWAVDHGGEQE